MITNKLTSARSQWEMRIENNPSSQKDKREKTTSVINNHQLLSVSCHGHHRAWETENLFLNSSNCEHTDQQGSGGTGSPALTQTDGLNLFILWHIHSPLLVGIPGAKMDAVELAKAETKSQQTSQHEVNTIPENTPVRYIFIRDLWQMGLQISSGHLQRCCSYYSGTEEPAWPPALQI